MDLHNLRQEVLSEAQTGWQTEPAKPPKNKYEARPFELPPLDPHSSASGNFKRKAYAKRPGHMPSFSLRRRTTAALGFPEHPTSVLSHNMRQTRYRCSPAKKKTSQSSGFFQQSYSKYSKFCDIRMAVYNYI